MLLLALSGLASGAPTLVAFSETDTSPSGSGGCGNEDVEAVAIYETPDFSQDQMVELRDLEVFAEARHEWCDVWMDDTFLYVDGVEVWSSGIGIRGRRALSAGWNESWTGNPPDRVRVRFPAGITEIEAVLEGRASGSEERVRITLSGDIEYGRDWDGDGHDDDRLTGGTDCDDDDASISPGEAEGLGGAAN